MNGVALKELARNLAIVMHEGQCRKATGEPYFNHVERVAQSVKGWEAQTVAYLHDVVEDTELTCEELSKIFPQHLVVAVGLLTRHHQGEETYADFIDRICAGNGYLGGIVHRSTTYAQLAIEVKIADVRDNLFSLDNIPGDTNSKEKRYTKALAKLLEAQES